MRSLHLEQKGDISALLGGPVYVIPHAMVPTAVLDSHEVWHRALFANGRHRLLESSRLGKLDPWRVAEALVGFDEWARVGYVIAIVDFDLSSKEIDPQAMRRSPCLALARLASVSTGHQHEGQELIVQRWQNLGNFKDHRG